MTDIRLKAEDGFAYRYLGDRASKTVHDLRQEDPTPTGCRIDGILAAGNAICFDPDDLRQAAMEGYKNCPRCLRRYDARHGLLQQLLYEPLKEELGRRRGGRGVAKDRRAHA